MTKTATQYNAYSGRNIDQMPSMLTQGVVPLPVVEFMRNREAVIGQLGDIYADTSDLVAYGGNRACDEIKMILTVDNQGRITEDGRKALKLISPSQERSSGAIVLSDELYDGFNGSNVIPLSRKDLKKYRVDRNQTETQVLNHPGWRVLLRHPDVVPAEFAYDKGLMQEVVGKTFSEMHKRHGYTEGMGFYLDATEEKSSKMRAWVVDRLGSRSGARGGYYLDYVDGRFVGIAPEALVMPTQSARMENAPIKAEADLTSSVKLYTTADLRAFDKAMKGLEGTLHPDVLKPFAELRKKL